VSYVFAFVGFALLIILHEAGHFAAAKAVGMRVERFSLFFGKPIARKTIGETEYRIGVIPLGGYVRITGMNPYEELEPDVAHRAFLRQPAWKRIFVIAAGPAVNLVIFFLLIFAILWSQGLQSDVVGVGSTAKGTPAASTLRAGDRIVSVDGVAGFRPGQSDAQIQRVQKALAAEINRHRCAGPLVPGCRAATPVKITVLRPVNGSTSLEGDPATTHGFVTKTLQVYPRYDTKNAPHRMRLGFEFGLRTVPIGPGQATTRTLSTGWDVTKATVNRITGIFVSSSDRKQVHGIVGAYATTQAVLATDDYVVGLQILALISLSLAIVNLFPFLPLDGGHIAWAVAEKIRGRAIPFTIIERASAVGFILIAFVFIVGLSNDIGQLTGPGFGVNR
jgi:regulator of sigma E protease